MLFKKGTNRVEAKGASPRPQRHQRSWLWCLSGGSKDVGPRSRMFYLQNAHFYGGGTGIRTGDTMIVRHMQKTLGMRQILIGERIYVHVVPSDTSWFCPYCCATVDTACVTLGPCGQVLRLPLLAYFCTNESMVDPRRRVMSTLVSST
jgi:hypothetical protein